MKRALAFVSAAATVFALAATPKKPRQPPPPAAYAEPDPYPPQGPYGFRSADPSFGNRGAIDYLRSLGQCVVDLGYGRYEYCD